MDNKNYLTRTQKTRSALFEDEETAKLLQELLQSKDPFELQLANRLIKSMVKDVSFNFYKLMNFFIINSSTIIQ